MEFQLYGLGLHIFGGRKHMDETDTLTNFEGQGEGGFEQNSQAISQIKPQCMCKSLKTHSKGGIRLGRHLMQTSNYTGRGTAWYLATC